MKDLLPDIEDFKPKYPKTMFDIILTIVTALVAGVILGRLFVLALNYVLSLIP